MSKYIAIWEYIKDSEGDVLAMTFSDVERVLGFSIDHAFLNSKKELLDFGYEVNKISLKEKKIIFIKK